LVTGGAGLMSTGRSLSILDVAQTLGRYLYGHRPPQIVQKFRSGDISHCFADVDRLQGLGYRPQVRFEEGMAELVKWVRSQRAMDSFEQAREELIHRGLAV
jgi:dTDP-L-rhamnose 4-epimerase